MPTGYTAPIADGISFEKFLLSCAREFGALIMMRDDPSDTPIPERFEASDYDQRELKRLREEMTRLDGMSHADAEDAARLDYNAQMERRAQYIRDKHALRAKYAAMLAQAKDWTPPTPDHQGLKDFMVKQIEESIDFDCNVYPEDAPRQKAGEDWLSEQIIETRRWIAYHEAEHAKKVERTENRNAWVKALRDSLA